jgi:hypothetical protein
MAAAADTGAVDPRAAGAGEHAGLAHLRDAHPAGVLDAGVGVERVHAGAGVGSADRVRSGERVLPGERVLRRIRVLRSRIGQLGVALSERVFGRAIGALERV